MTIERSASLSTERLASGAGGGWLQALARNYGAKLFLIVVALTVLRLAALAFSTTELFFDEAQYWFWSRELALGYYSKPPLIAWIIRGATDVCGMSEACIRAPSPVIHAATAMLVYAIGRKLYDARTGFWAGLVYVTLPGVSLSASLISTDAPLLFFVALALLAVVNLREQASSTSEAFSPRARPEGIGQQELCWRWVIVLGAAIGFGLLAKYAMAYFLLSLGLYVLVMREGRALLKDPRLYVAFLIAAVLVAPNIVWNAQNKFATLGHTADNAAWGGWPHPAAALEFLGGQFAVFGPVLFGVLLWVCLRALWRGKTPLAALSPRGRGRTRSVRVRGLLAATAPSWADEKAPSPGSAAPRRPLPRGERADSLLLIFSVPVLVLMLIQALLSRAHANWGAFAYIAATVLVIAVMLRADWTRLFRPSLGLHGAALVFILVGGIFAADLSRSSIPNPYERLLGWRAVAEAAAARAREGGFRAIATDKRSLAAELAYYLRDSGFPIVALRGGGKPHDHFELKRPLTADTPRPILLVSLGGAPRAGESAGQAEIPGGRRHRKVYFYAIRGSIE